MYVCEICFEFNLLQDLWASCSWMSISLPRFGKFPTIISLNMLFTHLSHYSPGISIMHVLFLWLVSPKAHKFSSFLLILFSFFLLLSDFKWPVFSSQILSSDSSQLLKLSTFLIPFIVFFGARIPVWFLMISICWTSCLFFFLCLILLSSLYVFLWSPQNFLRTIFFNSLSGNLWISTSVGLVIRKSGFPLHFFSFCVLWILALLY